MRKKKFEVPDDVVVYIMSRLGAYTRFPSKNEVIVKAFMRLAIAQNGKFRDMLKDLEFRTKYQSVYVCKQVDDVLERITLSGLVRRIDHDAYEITENFARKDYLKGIDIKTIKLIQEAADEFLKIIPNKRSKRIS